MLPCADLDLNRVGSPAYVIDMAALERNLQTLAHAQAASGSTILLALKGFATWSTFPLIGQYLDGISASGPDEARLGREELGKPLLYPDDPDIIAIASDQPDSEGPLPALDINDIGSITAFIHAWLDTQHTDRG